MCIIFIECVPPETGSADSCFDDYISQPAQWRRFETQNRFKVKAREIIFNWHLVVIREIPRQKNWISFIFLNPLVLKFKNQQQKNQFQKLFEIWKWKHCNTSKHWKKVKRHKQVIYRTSKLVASIDGNAEIFISSSINSRLSLLNT